MIAEAKEIILNFGNVGHHKNECRRESGCGVSGVIYNNCEMGTNANNREHKLQGDERNSGHKGDLYTQQVIGELRW